jgi:hypothetical protein
MRRLSLVGFSSSQRSAAADASRCCWLSYAICCLFGDALVVARSPRR